MRNNHKMMLGREKSPWDPRTIHLVNIFVTAAASVPREMSWHKYISNWGKMGNDRYGNCVIVTKAHMMMSWISNARKKPYSISDQAVINESRRVGALNGYNILSSMKEWRKRGFFNSKIWAFADLDLKIQQNVKACVFCFGAIELGVNLPNAWRGADIWDIGNTRDYTPGSWGGHSVPIVSYDDEYVYCVSWGELIPMTWNALRVYCDEAYTAIDASWLTNGGVTPSGLDLAGIHEWLAQVTTQVFE